MAASAQYVGAAHEFRAEEDSKVSEICSEYNVTNHIVR